MRDLTTVPAVLLMAWAGTLAAQDPAPQQPVPASGVAATTSDSPKAGAPTAPNPTVKPSPGAPVDPKAYQIGAEDVISIRVWHEPENSGQFVVRPDGKVSVPLIGDVQAAGLTPYQLSQNIAEGLQKIMVHPEVTVGVERVMSKKYYIQGEVNRPGSYPLVIDTTILEALVNAGGFRDFANTKKIVILRGSDRLKFNYNEVTKGKKMDQNILLKPGDQIIVP